MGTLFHAFSDLLSFGTLVILAMILGGVVVVLTMLADSVWLLREAHRLHDEDAPPGWLTRIRHAHGEKQLKKTA